MFRVNDIIGLPITEKETGKTVSHVKSVIMDDQAGQVLGFVLRKNLLKKQMEVLKYQYVIALDRNLVIVDFGFKNARMIKEEKMDGQVEYENIIENLVINRNGDILGIITDLYFDENTGRIVAYEISEGFIDDVLYGRKLIKPSNELRLVPNYSFQPDQHARVLYRNLYGKE